MQPARREQCGGPADMPLQRSDWDNQGGGIRDTSKPWHATLKGSVNPETGGHAAKVTVGSSRASMLYI